MKSFIRWAGSKKQLLPILREYRSSLSSRYVEPFCGSACLFFDLEPEKALLGDLNSELIATLRAVKHDASGVAERLRKLPTGKSAYYRIRAQNSTNLAESDVAARFLYLNRHCFNGIYRTNLSGQFNVPLGKHKKRKGYDYEALVEASKLLGRAELLDGDYQLTLDQTKAGDFVYLDPPYTSSRRRIFGDYNASKFTLNNLRQLGDWLVILNDRGVGFVISYADSKDARAILAAWPSRRVRVRRNVAGFAADRRGAYELIASNLQ